MSHGNVEAKNAVLAPLMITLDGVSIKDHRGEIK